MIATQLHRGVYAYEVGTYFSNGIASQNTDQDWSAKALDIARLLDSCERTGEKAWNGGLRERKQKAVQGLLRGRDATKSATEVNVIEIGTSGDQT